MPMFVDPSIIRQLREDSLRWERHRFGRGPHRPWDILLALVFKGAISHERAALQADELAASLNDWPTLAVWTHEGAIMAWGPEEMDPLRDLTLT